MTEWIPWDGGKCPIKDIGQKVDVKFRCGITSSHTCSDFRWFHIGEEFHSGGNDIIAYRLIEKEQSDLDWLEGEIEEDLAYWTKNHDPKHEFTKGVKASHKDILHLIKQRREAKS
jgi:hypothetical protein